MTFEYEIGDGITDVESGTIEFNIAVTPQMWAEYISFTIDPDDHGVLNLHKIKEKKK